MEFNEYILWSQGVTTSNSIFLKDGCTVNGNESNEILSFINHIDGIHQWIELKKELEDAKRKHQSLNEFSASLRLYTDNDKNILVLSHYTDKDDEGRRIVFAFCSKGSDFQVAAERLENVSRSVGRTCNPADLHLLRLLNNKPKKNHNLIFIIVLLILFLLWALYITQFGSSQKRDKETDSIENVNKENIEKYEIMPFGELHIDWKKSTHISSHYTLW